ncbi:MAG: glycosyl transferase [Phormidesmis priestleyi]|uniref:Glycosyl transferase n=1 Tax=Phormidesmis priestleyi TaxID=268141 RepID=A0A2W4XR46_9CYAN|nr:MAG: glycosyl transferase [Phormidesmis priestleyi]
MKILHLSTADANGGAAKGAYSMHKALCAAGVDSHMLVADKFTSDRTVTGSTGITGSQKVQKGLCQTLEYWPLRRYKNKRPGAFSAAVYPSRIAAQVEAIDPDIINLHWVAKGLLRPSDLQKFQRQRPRHLVWTLRDMWAFTGGCHYSGDCSGYQTGCGQCPLLGSSRLHDLSYQVWQRKHAAWKDLTITLAPLSEWLADCARQSKLFAHQPIQVIPNAIDTDKYRPIDRAIARHVLNLPQDKKLILFGALQPTADTRKGFSYLQSALHHLAAQPNHNQLQTVIFGTDKPDQDLDLKLPTTFLGHLHDDTTLALAYSAADVMVVPSTQEAFGKTVIEAMACATPVVAFNSTGLKDSVVHQHNGYTAQCFDAIDLAHGISWVLESSDRLHTLSQNARQTIENQFTFARIAEQYQQLYQQLLTEPKNIS